MKQAVINEAHGELLSGVNTNGRNNSVSEDIRLCVIGTRPRVVLYSLGNNLAPLSTCRNEASLVSGQRAAGSCEKSIRTIISPAPRPVFQRS